jgi:hypothetical protein
MEVNRMCACCMKKKKSGIRRNLGHRQIKSNPSLLYFLSALSSKIRVRAKLNRIAFQHLDSRYEEVASG